MQKSQIRTPELGEVENDTSKIPSTTPTPTVPPLNEPQNSEIKKTYMFEIPLELLGNIVNKYISHPDKLQLRLVHPIFRTLLDTYIGFKVTLDDGDSTPKFDFISELAIRKMTIQNLTSFNPSPRYPHLVQEVTLQGKIDATIFNWIVRNCTALKSVELCPGSNIKPPHPPPGQKHTKKGKNKVKIKSLDRLILPEVDIFTSSSSSQEVNYMSNVRWVKLLLNQDTPDPGDSSQSPDLNTEAVLSVMKSLRSSHLERVVIQGWISERFSVALITHIAAECLERNPRIESFFLGVIYEHMIADEDPIPEGDVKLRALTLEKLEKAGDVVNIEKFGISTQSCDLVLWKAFLKRQHNLVHISFTVDLVEGGFSGEMFKSSAKSLKQFILRGKFLTAFDCNWVEDCTNLKEICLHNIDHYDQATATVLHVVNSSSIPDGLESLVLFQTICRSDDIRVAVRKLKLKTLVLFKTGNSAGETGLNVESLKLIFQCRTLMSTLLVRFVAPNPVEAAELVKILQTMNDGQIHREVFTTEEIIQLIPTEPEIIFPLPVDVDPDVGEDEPPPLQRVASSRPWLVARESTEDLGCLLDAQEDASVSVEKSEVEETTSAENEQGGGGAVGGAPSKSTKKARKIAVPEDLETEEGEGVTGTSPCVKPQSLITIDDIEVRSSQKRLGGRPRHEDDPLLNCQNHPEEDIAGAAPLITIMEPNLLPEQIGEKQGTDVNHNDTPLPRGSINTMNSSVPESITPPEVEEAEGMSKTGLNANLPPASNNDNDLPEVGDPVPDDPQDQGQDGGGLSTDDDDDVWEDLDSDDDDDDTLDSDDEGVFDLDLDDLNLDVLEQVAEAQAMAGGPGNVQLILNLQNEDDLQEMLGLLEPVAQNANLNQIQFGFILDGVIDIQDPDTKRSRWAAVEDEEGHLTYTLKISID